MIIKEIATIPFRDDETGDNAFAIVRRCGDRVAVALTVEHGNDMEVFLDVDVARRLAETINEGIKLIGSTD
jgi:hypothetical protein